MKFSRIKSVYCFASIVAVALLLFAGCTFYDNYDITLMPATANNGDDDGKSSSSSKGSDTIKVIIVNPSSDSKSSSSMGVPTWTCGDSVMVRGDEEYETVEIGGVCVTKRNLNYKPTGKSNSLCFDHLDENCEKYGRMYDYDAAKGVCPEGWRLMTEDDLQRFLTYTGLDYREAGPNFKAPGAWLGEVDDGNDETGFSALPGGWCDVDEDCGSEGYYSQWWTSTEIQKDYSHITFVLTSDDNGAYIKAGLENLDYAYVRCVWKKQ